MNSWAVKIMEKNQLFSHLLPRIFEWRLCREISRIVDDLQLTEYLATRQEGHDVTTPPGVGRVYYLY